MKVLVDGVAPRSPWQLVLMCSLAATELADLGACDDKECVMSLSWLAPMASRIIRLSTCPRVAERLSSIFRHT